VIKFLQKNKLKIFMEIHNLDPSHFNIDEIESIEFIGEQDTVDITVDDTHMFFANDVYSHNSALEEDVIDASKVAESYGKVMVADFIISLSRKVTDKLAGTGRWHVIKNRFGPDGITFPSKINTSNGQFNIYNDTSVQGKDAQKQMDNGNEYARKLLAQKYKEMTNDGFE
jgi:hypothetical protein